MGLRDILPTCLGGRMSGWGHGIENGDYLIIAPHGRETRYQVESIRYCSDPPDMWFADVVFAPRQG